jgi:hypothetical protein
MSRETLKTLKGTVEPDWISRRVEPLQKSLSGYQPLYAKKFCILILVFLKVLTVLILSYLMERGPGE